jgi:uncharacterized membrane protein
MPKIFKNKITEVSNTEMKIKNQIMYRSKLQLALLLAGIIFLCVGIKLTYNSVDHLNNSIRTKATITGYRIEVKKEYVEGHSKTKSIYYPQFKFKDQQNNIIESQSIAAQSYSGAYSVGEQVEVLYEVNSPQNVIINSFVNLWLAPLLLGIFSIIFLKIGF